MLKIFIEASALEEPLPMEVADDAPVSRLIPALVNELGLPQTDPDGGQLIYVLRLLRDGKVLLDNLSLRMAGVRPETYLVLEPYTLDGTPLEKVNAHNWQRQRSSQVLATQAVAYDQVQLYEQAAPVSQQSAFYSDRTIADDGMFTPFGNSVPDYAPLPYISAPLPTYAPPPKPKRRTRRAALVSGGIILGLGGLAVSYAAFRSLTQSAHPNASTSNMQVMPTAKPAATTAPQAVTPTQATHLLTFDHHQQTVRTVTWSPAGTLLLSGANDKQMLTWDLQNQVHIRKNIGNTVHAVGWSPDNTLLAAAAGNEVFFFAAQDGQTRGKVAQTRRSTINTIAWSNQQPQMLVSAGSDKLAVVWNTQTFQAQTTFKLHSTSILSAAWARESQAIATSSQGGVTRVWNAQDNQEIHPLFIDGQVAMHTLAFAPNNALAVGGDDGILRLWTTGLNCQTTTNGQCQDAPQHLHGHSKVIRSVGWSPDGRLLASAGDDGQLLIWEPTKGLTPVLKVQQQNPVLALNWSPDGKKIATAVGNTVTIWALT